MQFAKAVEHTAKSKAVQDAHGKRHAQFVALPDIAKIAGAL